MWIRITPNTNTFHAMEFFWFLTLLSTAWKVSKYSLFSGIPTEYWYLQNKSPYSAQIRENVDQKKLCILDTFHTMFMACLEGSKLKVIFHRNEYLWIVFDHCKICWQCCKDHISQNKEGSTVHNFGFEKGYSACLSDIKLPWLEWKFLFMSFI